MVLVLFLPQMKTLLPPPVITLIPSQVQRLCLVQVEQQVIRNLNPFSAHTFCVGQSCSSFMLLNKRMHIYIACGGGGCMWWRWLYIIMCMAVHGGYM